MTADALRILGHRDQAMTRYARALESSDEDRLQVRLALGRLFAEEGKTADAQQQVALGFAEARVAPTDVTSAEDYLNAADILMSIHEYPLAQRMYGRAQALGADDTAVAVGMANASLALGDTRSAELQLASLPDDPDRKNNYDFLVAQGNVYRQLGENDRALATFVQANQLDPQDPATRTAEMELAEEEGRPITDRLGMGSDVRVNAVFEDENIYQMDARLLGVQNNAALVAASAAFDRDLRRFALSIPAGFVSSDSRFRRRTQCAGRHLISEPASDSGSQYIRHHLQYFRGAGCAAGQREAEHYARNAVHQSGATRWLRVPMNQNLFRQFLYVASSPIGNWLSFSGNLIREAGPFTEQDLHSRDFSGALDFRVGRPWGKTALLTGYSAARSAVRTVDSRVLPDSFLCRSAAWIRFPHPGFGGGGVSPCLAGGRQPVCDRADSSSALRGGRRCLISTGRCPPRARGLPDAAFTPMTM